MVIDKILEITIPYITSTLELIGVIIIVIGASRALYNVVTNKFNFDEHAFGVRFAKSMALSLEFKLAAEIIKTVIIRDLDEFIILAAVATLRVVITLVLHWELKSGNKDVFQPEDSSINSN